MRFYSKLLAAASLTSLSSMALATPLNDYNLILFGNLNPSGDVHVDGSAFVGGSINANGIFGASLGDPAFNASNNLEVVGNVNTGNLHIQNGYLAYGGTLSNQNKVICNESGLAQHNCVRQLDQAVLADKRDDLYTTLSAESSYYQSLAPTLGASITGDNNNKTLSYTGLATELVVFNVAGADLFGTGGWNVNLGLAERFVINVSGVNLGANAATNLNVNYSYADNILWNFYEAETINFQRNWVGSVLALDSVINTTNNFNGAVAAQSYVGRGEFHKFQWDYTPPTKDVPESGSLMLLLTGLGLMGLTRLRRRR